MKTRSKLAFSKILLLCVMSVAVAICGIGAVFAFTYKMDLDGSTITQTLIACDVGFSKTDSDYTTIFSTQEDMTVTTEETSTESEPTESELTESEPTESMPAGMTVTTGENNTIIVSGAKYVFGDTPFFKLTTATDAKLTLVKTVVNGMVINSLSLGTFKAINGSYIKILLSTAVSGIEEEDNVEFTLKVSTDNNASALSFKSDTVTTYVNMTALSNLTSSITNDSTIVLSGSNMTAFTNGPGTQTPLYIQLTNNFANNPVKVSVQSLKIKTTPQSIGNISSSEIAVGASGEIQIGISGNGAIVITLKIENVNASNTFNYPVTVAHNSTNIFSTNSDVSSSTIAVEQVNNSAIKISGKYTSNVFTATTNFTITNHSSNAIRVALIGLKVGTTQKIVGSLGVVYQTVGGSSNETLAYETLEIDLKTLNGDSAPADDTNIEFILGFDKVTTVEDNPYTPTQLCGIYLSSSGNLGTHYSIIDLIIAKKLTTMTYTANSVTLKGSKSNLVDTNNKTHIKIQNLFANNPVKVSVQSLTIDSNPQSVDNISSSEIAVGASGEIQIGISSGDIIEITLKIENVNASNTFNYSVTVAHNSTNIFSTNSAVSSSTIAVEQVDNSAIKISGKYTSFNVIDDKINFTITNHSSNAMRVALIGLKVGGTQKIVGSLGVVYQTISANSYGTLAIDLKTLNGGSAPADNTIIEFILGFDNVTTVEDPPYTPTPLCRIYLSKTGNPGTYYSIIDLITDGQLEILEYTENSVTLTGFASDLVDTNNKTHIEIQNLLNDLNLSCNSGTAIAPGESGELEIECTPVSNNVEIILTFSTSTT